MLVFLRDYGRRFNIDSVNYVSEKIYEKLFLDFIDYIIWVF